MPHRNDLSGPTLSDATTMQAITRGVNVAKTSAVSPDQRPSQPQRADLNIVINHRNFGKPFTKVTNGPPETTHSNERDGKVSAWQRHSVRTDVMADASQRDNPTPSVHSSIQKKIDVKPTRPSK